MTETAKERKFKPIAGIDKALEIYYRYPELSNALIQELFGTLSKSSIRNYKKAVRDKQTELNVKTCTPNAVNTEVAFKVWGIDVKDLERRRDKLIKLGFAV